MENEAINPTEIEQAFARFLRDFEDENGQLEYHTQVDLAMSIRLKFLGWRVDPKEQGFAVSLCRLHAYQALQREPGASCGNGLLQVCSLNLALEWFIFSDWSLTSDAVFSSL